MDTFPRDLSSSLLDPLLNVNHFKGADAPEDALDFRRGKPCQTRERKAKALIFTQEP